MGHLHPLNKRQCHFPYLHGTITCTEEQVKNYCKNATMESDIDAYSMDEDDPFYDPFPYTSSFEYQAVARLQLEG